MARAIERVKRDDGWHARCRTCGYEGARSYLDPVKAPYDREVRDLKGPITAVRA